MEIWNVSSGVCERTLKGHTDAFMEMVLLLDGRLCSVSYDGSLKIWNMETGECDLTNNISFGGLSRVIQLHDCRLVVSDSSRRAVYVIGG
jgi:WD40 repeat protein